MQRIVEYPDLEGTSKDHWVWLLRVTILGILRFQSQASNDQGKTGLKLPVEPQYSLCMFLSTLFLLSWAHFFFPKVSHLMHSVFLVSSVGTELVFCPVLPIQCLGLLSYLWYTFQSSDETIVRLSAGLHMVVICCLWVLCRHQGVLSQQRY